MAKHFLAEQFEVFEQEYLKTAGAKPFKILGPWIKEIRRTAVLRTLPIGARPLCLSLSTVTTGMSGFGSCLKTLQDNLASLTIETCFEKDNKGGALLLQSSLPTITLALSAGIPYFLDRFGDQKTRALLSLELLLDLATSTGLISETYHALLDACGASPDKKEIGVDLLSFATLVLILLVTKTYYDEDPKVLFDRIKRALHDPLIRILPHIQQRSGIGFFLRESEIALQAGNTEDFIEAGIDSLERLGFTEAFLNQDLKLLSQYSKQIVSLLQEGGDKDINKLTGIFQAG